MKGLLLIALLSQVLSPSNNATSPLATAARSTEPFPLVTKTAIAVMRPCGMSGLLSCPALLEDNVQAPTFTIWAPTPTTPQPYVGRVDVSITVHSKLVANLSVRMKLYEVAGNVLRLEGEMVQKLNAGENTDWAATVPLVGPWLTTTTPMRLVIEAVFTSTAGAGIANPQPGQVTALPTLVVPTDILFTAAPAAVTPDPTDPPSPPQFAALMAVALETLAAVKALHPEPSPPAPTVECVFTSTPTTYANGDMGLRCRVSKLSGFVLAAGASKVDIRK